MSIPSVVLDLWQFSFVRDLPEIRKLEISPSELCPISGNWSELETANLVWMFLMKCYWNARCQWNGCYSFSVFSNKKIFLFIFWIATSKKPLSIVKTSARKFESMVYTLFFFLGFLVILKAVLIFGPEFCHKPAYLLSFCLVWIMLKSKDLLQSLQQLINLVIQFHNYDCFYYFPRLSAKF